MPLVARLGSKTTFSDDLNERDRGRSYTCPNCEKRMIVVIPEWKIKHFRHHEGQDCNTEPESREHILMKKNVSAILAEWNHKYEIELEKKVPVDGAPNGFRVADIRLANRVDGTRIAIECQVSPIDEIELLQRTLDYNKKNYHVLWVLSSSTFTSYGHKVLERRVSDAELLLHQIYYARVYYMNTEEPTIYASHFERVTRTDDHYGYTRTLKNTVSVNSQLIPKPKIYTTKTVFRIARFEETKWW